MTLSFSEIQRYATDPCAKASQTTIQELAQAYIEVKSESDRLQERNRELRADIKKAYLQLHDALDAAKVAQRQLTDTNQRSAENPDAIAAWRKSLSEAQDACRRLRLEKDAAIRELDAARKKRRPFLSLCFGGTHWHGG